MSDGLIRAAAKLSKGDSEVRCHTCKYWTPCGAKPLLSPDFGECAKGVSTTQSRRRTDRDFQCIKHSALEEARENNDG